MLKYCKKQNPITNNPLIKKVKINFKKTKKSPTDFKPNKHGVNQL